MDCQLVDKQQRHNSQAWVSGIQVRFYVKKFFRFSLFIQIETVQNSGRHYATFLVIKTHRKLQATQKGYISSDQIGQFVSLKIA